MKITECQTIKDALLRCIEQEQISFEQYNTQANRTLNLHQKSIWEQLANDELRHKTMLYSLLEDSQFISQNYVSDIEPSKLNYLKIELPVNPIKAIYMKAINAEIEAYNEYLDIANHTQDEELRNLFSILSKEELGHKQVLEEELQTIG